MGKWFAHNLSIGIGVSKRPNILSEKRSCGRQPFRTKGKYRSSSSTYESTRVETVALGAPKMRICCARKRLFVMLVTALISSCCAFGTEITNPIRPQAVHGWRTYETGSITVKGEFVLNKGESTNDGHIGVQITDVIPVKYHVLGSAELPKAKVRFFRPQDHTTICEVIFTRGGNGLARPEFCEDQLPWTYLYSRCQGWVFFDLR